MVENPEKDVTLLNVSKNSHNVNVSVANSIISWVVGLFSSSQKEGTDGKKAE